MFNDVVIVLGINTKGSRIMKVVMILWKSDDALPRSEDFSDETALLKSSFKL